MIEPMYSPDSPPPSPAPCFSLRDGDIADPLVPIPSDLRESIYYPLYHPLLDNTLAISHILQPHSSSNHHHEFENDIPCFAIKHSLLCNF